MTVFLLRRADGHGRLLGIQRRLGQTRWRNASIPLQLPDKPRCDVPTHCCMDNRTVARVWRYGIGSFRITLTDRSHSRSAIDQQHTEFWSVEPSYPPACIVTDANAYFLYRYTTFTSFCFTIVCRYRGRRGAGGDTVACKAHPRVCRW